MRRPGPRPTTTPAQRALLVLVVVGVTVYVATWALLGILAEGYDPWRQAISELFAIGAPQWQRRLLGGVLVATGIALLPVGPVLDRVLPGRGRLGPLLTVVAGVGTVLAAVYPCSPGCPGYGVTTTDTMHTIVAGGGYLGLVLAPLAFAWRLRDTTWRDLALAGVVLGGLATAGFVVRSLGVDVLGGLQQRVFNTLADAWFVLVALAVLRRTQPPSRSTPDRASRTQHSTP